MGLKEYNTVVNGLPTVLQLSDEDAKLQGFTSKDVVKKSTRPADADTAADAAKAEAQAKADREKAAADAEAKAKADAEAAEKAAKDAAANKSATPPANK